MGLHTQFTNPETGFESDDIRPCSQYVAVFDALCDRGHKDLAEVLSYDQEEKAEIPPALRAAWIRAGEILDADTDPSADAPKQTIREIVEQIKEATHIELWF